MGRLLFWLQYVALAHLSSLLLLYWPVLLLTGPLHSLRFESTSRGPSTYLSPIDLKDDRLAKSTGYDLIYEARDLDLQNIRDGLTQARSSLSDTKSRIAESKQRLS